MPAFWIDAALGARAPAIGGSVFQRSAYSRHRFAAAAAFIILQLAVPLSRTSCQSRPAAEPAVLFAAELLGMLNFGALRYCVDAGELAAARAKGVEITLGKQVAW